VESREVFIAHTHREWFDFLSRHTENGRLDEVNFWFPKSQKPPKNFRAGEPIFFRLGAPERKVAGYGFFASFQLLPLSLAWDSFGHRNGAVDRSTFHGILGRITPEQMALPLACMVLLEARFWPDSRWIPWASSRGYAESGVQMGRTDIDPTNLELLFEAMRRDAAEAPTELGDDFEPLDVDEREVASADIKVREGQGAFRLRLLETYRGCCAITGEHTEPVLDAAHIQGYLGPRSNHPQNGLILTKEFHALFDKGLVTIEPPLRSSNDYRIRVSRLIRERWKNGRRYNEFDGLPLVSLPRDPRLRPSPGALEWHREVRFEKVA
jgi:putative restriction endonuclease